MDKKDDLRIVPQKKGGFFKNGQIKVGKGPKEKFKKLAEHQVEYGVDDLVEDSMNQEDIDKEEATDASEDSE